MTLTQRSYKLFRSRYSTALYLNRAIIRNDPFDNSMRQFRKAGYRQFILDKYGYLGRGNHKVLPSCKVRLVSAKFP